MRSVVRSSLALMSFSAILSPAHILAQAPAAAPAGYSMESGPVMIGSDGKPVAVQPVKSMQTTAAPATAAPHAHRFRTLCAKCAKKVEAMPTERIIACAHSKNGVCPTCQTLLAMPGTVTIGAPAPAPGEEAPGRAMATNMPSPSSPAAMNQYAAQSKPVSAVYDPANTPEPTPIGVMRTNYAQPGMAQAAPAGAAAGIPTASSLQPGHALAESSNNPAPFQHKPTSSKNPHVIGHVLGFYGIGSDLREERAQRKAQAHPGAWLAGGLLGRAAGGGGVSPGVLGRAAACTWCGRGALTCTGAAAPSRAAEGPAAAAAAGGGAAPGSAPRSCCSVGGTASAPSSSGSAAASYTCPPGVQGF